MSTTRIETEHGSELRHGTRGFQLRLHQIASISARIKCFGNFVTCEMHFAGDEEEHEVCVFGDSVAEFLALIPSATVTHVAGCSGHPAATTQPDPPVEQQEEVSS